MKSALLGLAILFTINGLAQDKWTLERCVTYAIQNNITVKQADIQERMAAVDVKQAEAGKYPNLNFSSDVGYNLGRSINRATNAFGNEAILFSGFRLQSGVTLFNWFSQKHTTEASKLDQQAAKAATDKVRNDIALNVAVAYLQALLANEQVEVSVVQIEQTTAQYENIRKLVKAGALPELNAAEIEAQLARDSAAYITARSGYQQQIIFLKALLSLNMSEPFDIAKPEVSTIPVESLADLQPEYVYQQALKNLPQQRVNEFRYQAAQKNILAAKAAMYPTISGFASIGSNYSSNFPDQQRISYVPTGGYDTSFSAVEVTPGNFKPVLNPKYVVTVPNTRFGRQMFDINLSQAIGISLNVPIFQNRILRSSWERSKLTAENYKLQSDQDNLTLQQDIYTAYNDAINAMQRYNAAAKAVEAAEKAFSFSTKRYQAGLLQTIELITNQSNLYRTRLDALSARYEFVFRMKLLEFYKGAGMKL
jgi:outer membrane protein